MGNNLLPEGQGATGLSAQSWPGNSQDRLWVTEETPVAICYNGISHVVMMATPTHLAELALGFSLSEDIVDNPAQVFAITEKPAANGIEVHLDISGDCFQRLKARRRHLAGRTGCGLCGVEALDDFAARPPIVSFQGGVSHAAIQRALADFSAHQPLYRQTGAVHGAAWCHRDGAIQTVMEDVGRHNALDKLIGRLARADEDSREGRDGFLLISSRISYEIVQKSARANIALIAAISAPTSLAIKLAGRSGITLVGFVRVGRHSLYSHGERLNATRQPVGSPQF